MQPGKRRSWGPLGVGLGSLAALIAVGLAFGVPGADNGCGGPLEATPVAPADHAQVTAAVKAPDCGEVTTTRVGTCVDVDSSGVRTCQAEDTPTAGQCAQGCQPGTATFSWKDEFGEVQKLKPTKDFAAMCENRKPPGLDCTYVETIPCFTTK